MTTEYTKGAVDESKEESPSDVQVGNRMMYSITPDHRLTSTERGGSEVEKLAARIERRREERIVITFDVRVALVEGCREIAINKNYDALHKILLEDLFQFKRDVEERYEQGQKTIKYKILKLLGFRNQSEQLIRVLDRAIDLVQNEQEAEDDWFHYMDFNIFYTRVESRWPWMRSGVTVAFLWLFLYYFATPILFCTIMEDGGVCPRQKGKPYSGWLAALYFASTTLSTVGYGDLSVSKTENWSVFIGTVYMIFSNVILIVAFSAAAASGSAPLAAYQEKILMRVIGKPSNDEPLYKKIRRLKFLRITQITLSFIILNLVGVFANRLFLLGASDELKSQWNWMISFYWAVQTTTTIGYGDLTQPENMRWFQVFYLIFSTYFVGSALSGLASLKVEIDEVSRKTAWGRREVSRGLIDECQPEEHDDRIDQYEFLVASLIQLGKISSFDVEPIMDKFRELAKEKGFISVTDAKKTQVATVEEIESILKAKNNPITAVFAGQEV